MKVSIYALPSLYKQRKNHLTEEDLPEILDIICRKTNTTIEDIHAPSPRRDFATIRFIFYLLAKRNVNAPLGNIGKFVGRKQHGSVMKGIERIEKKMNDDPMLKRLVSQIDASIKALVTKSIKELVGTEETNLENK